MNTLFFHAQPASHFTSQQVGTPLRIAITGGVAEGKTTVLQLFQQRGGQTISSDALVASLLRPGTDLWSQLVKELGNAILSENGELDRARLAMLAFGEARLRRRLNQLLHPTAVEAMRTLLKETAATVIFVEVPLLIEVCLQDAFDRIVVVQATPALQRARLMARGVPPKLARQILHAQLPTRAKVPFADWVIRTHRTLEEVAHQVERIWRSLQRDGVY
jgi:dephospho-CoA kinase